MKRTWLALFAAFVLHAAAAAPIDLVYDSPRESKALGTPLSASTPVRIDGRLAGTGSIVDTLSFVAGSTALSMSAGWLLAPASNRTVGVNIDLFDSSNMLVASDTFLGSDGTLASSRLAASGLTAGASYRLEFTGTAIGFGRFHMDLADGTVVLPISVLPPVAPDVNAARFDTRIGSKSFPTTLSAGRSFVIDGAFDGGGAIDDQFEFVVTDGTLSAGIEWIVNTATDPVRTVGVNVDVFDSLHNLVVSDTFLGVTAGQAFSQLVATGLANGTYTLEFTGLAPNARGRYRIDLATSATAPGFRPIVDVPVLAVPEPSTLALMAWAGMALVLAGRGSRRTGPRRRPS